jgi:CubicO group peptidase (beta-lactamase class C family)
MSTGNYFSASFMADDESEKMGDFFGAQPYKNRIKEAFSALYKSNPGEKWVYRTSDTFILTRALHNFLQKMEGDSADIYQLVVDEIYQPLGIGPGFFTTMRTADNNWQGQAEGGYGQWWTPDDIARIGDFLLNEKGQVNGEQVLKPELLAASLQQDSADRGVRIDSQRMYNNAFWATHFSHSNGFDCEFWVPQMLGVSGNLVALFPNGVVYYYFSDNDEFVYIQALMESDKIIPLCP